MDGDEQECESSVCSSQAGPVLEPFEFRWIPVTERLPEEEAFVLIFVGLSLESAVVSAFWDTKSFWEHNWRWSPTEVTHWMPLPAAPDRSASKLLCKEVMVQC
jgi:hypothetical protein